MVGRPPKPTAIRALEGNPGHRPLPVGEPTSVLNGPSEPPGELGDDAAGEWRRMRAQLITLGIADQVDVEALNGYALAWHRYREAEYKRDEEGDVIPGARGGAIMNPWVRVSHAEQDKMYRFMSECGLLPSSRARVRLSERAGKPKNGLESIIARRSG